MGYKDNLSLLPPEGGFFVFRNIGKMMREINRLGISSIAYRKILLVNSRGEDV